jgi:hypothetical protein
MEERPGATLPQRREYLQEIARVKVSGSTLSRMLRRMEQKKRSVGASERDEFLRAAWRTLVAGGIDAKRLVFVGEMGTNTSLASLYGWSRRGRRAHLKTPRNRGSNVTHLASITREGMGPCLAVEGATTREVFEAYLEHVLAPSLRPGEVVVMDNLSAHKRVERCAG